MLAFSADSLQNLGRGDGGAQIPHPICWRAYGVGCDAGLAHAIQDKHDAAVAGYPWCYGQPSCTS